MTAAQISLPRPLSGPPVRRLLFVAILAAVVAATYLIWFRDSDLVAVEAVRIEGIDPRANDGDELAAALEDAARDLTTLNVRPEVLEQAAEPFPLVSEIRAEADFPHKLTVHVVTRRPVARIGTGEDARAVDATGIVLPAMDLANFQLPRLPLEEPPAHVRLEGGVADQVRVLAAAPQPLLELAEGTRTTPRGVEVLMPDGLELRFGTPAQAAEKWRAAAAILADPGLTDLGYVDLASPARSAAGGSGVDLPEAG